MFRFKLRAILTLIAVLSIGMAASLTPEIRHAKREQEAIRWLISNDFSAETRPASRRVRLVLGDHARVVISVSLSPEMFRFQTSGMCVYGVEISDAFLGHLQVLQNLERLDLRYTDFDDDDVRTISGLAKLRFVRLTHSKVTSDGARHLAAMNHLRSIDLRWSDYYLQRVKNGWRPDGYWQRVENGWQAVALELEDRWAVIVE